MLEPFTCWICDKRIYNEHTNNAEPVSIGVCCNDCNNKVVIPARISQLYSNNT